MTTPEARAPGFDFARKLRDPAFRSYIALHGYVSGSTVVIAQPGESWESAMQRLDNPDAGGLLARPDPEAEFGWRLWCVPDRAFRETLDEVLEEQDETLRRLAPHDGGGATAADYATLEGNLVQLDTHVLNIAARLREDLARAPDSENHRLQVMVGMLSEVKQGDPTTLGAMLVVALARLSACTGRHWVEADDSDAEDW